MFQFLARTNVGQREDGETPGARHKKGSRAISITCRYRASYVVSEGVNVWYWVGSHSNYNNFIGSK